MWIIILLIDITIIEYNILVIPKKNVPTIIIREFIIKLDIDTFILKYFLSIRFITVIPPDISGDYPLYSGQYTVTPKAKESQVLPTAKTVLLNDVTVKKVPLYQTSNTSGGNTVYIATEVF